MPVTAKLSRQFYERFGDQLTNELVEWFNAVDATYQSGLRELNEANFVRFEAKLGQRLAELETRLERRFAAVDARFGAFEANLERRFAALDARFDAFEARLFRWIVGLSTTTLLAVVGVVIAVTLGR
ncbi:MAG TPA: hypothetical protein VIH11_05580 [Gemmatimonadaceae bacterium]|nr:hypothetical protein [Gemmatimonadaceae bacterium]